jgi:TolB-like protein/class 3 adenylate cyclase/Tfp pilus assembly protein PilF
MLPSRQLAAIMFTDIEGYTAIMQQNEHKALTLKDRHRLVLETEHGNFDGKIVQYYGDGTLSIFSSVVQAVKCALEMQKAYCQWPTVPVRIGLHVGDVIINDGHIFGDGVNLASRIESLGVPGSVLLSDKVMDEIRNQPDIKTQSLGTFKFKNVEREVEVFSLDDEALVQPQRESLKGKTEEKKQAAVPASFNKSIAVLPFVNMSNDPEQEYFSDGIAEEILNSLSHLKNLDVAGRTSSFQFKGKNIDLRELGKKLGVTAVLEGSVRKQRNRLRVTAQLINVEDGFHMWSEKYDREMDDIFAIQDEIALSVTENLKITLLDKEKSIITGSAPTENKMAYDLYLKGRFYWNRRGPGLKKALEFFLQSAQLDPEFSLAHAGIADTYALFAFYSVLPPHEVIPKAKQAAERAITLNPSRVEPYSVLAYITAFYDWDWEKAEKEFQNAISINPAYAPAHYWYSNYLSFVKRDFKHSEEEAQKAIDLDPFIPHTHNTLASLYITFGKFDEAVAVAKTSIELDENIFLSHYFYSTALGGLGRYEEAIEAINAAMTISYRHQYALSELSWLYYRSGNIEAARKLYDELLKRSETEFVSKLSISVAAYSSGDHDKAYEFMEQAFKEKSSLLVSIDAYPYFSYIKADPRFQTFIQRMNFPANK